MAMAGRKSKLTPEVQQNIMAALSGGATIKDACAYAGISQDSYERYIKNSTDFADAVKKAQAQARIGAIARIQKAGREGIWTADAWFLERSDPEHWARRDTLKIEGLQELLNLCKQTGVKASDLFNAMIAELIDADSTTGRTTGTGKD
jgi:hypothetical protein